MPIIPVVGRRSWSMRFLIAGLYGLLSLGAVTMVYPFALMAVTATTGNADWRAFRLIPCYWTSRTDQFRKYVTDKSPIEFIAYDYARDDWHSPTDTRIEHLQPICDLPDQVVNTIAQDYKAFVSQLAPGLKHLNFVHHRDLEMSELSIADDYFRWLEKRYDGDMDRVNFLYADTAHEQWSDFGLPTSHKAVGDWPVDSAEPRYADWRAFVATRDVGEIRLIPIDLLTYEALHHRFVTVSNLNVTHNVSFASFHNIEFADLKGYPWAESVRERVLRINTPLAQLRLAEQARHAFESFRDAEQPRIDTPFSSDPPTDPRARALWIRFIRSDRCNLNWIAPIDPRRLWQVFLQQRYSTVAALNKAHHSQVDDFNELRLPTAIIDYAWFKDHQNRFFLRFLFGHFSTVIDFILLHGRALTNTLIYIILAIVGALTINPMAAYALSRFRLRQSHHILLFLLATMALPAEVVMIPNFLTVKRFPLGVILLIVVMLCLFALIRAMMKKRMSATLSAFLGVSITAIAAWYLPPRIAAMIGREDLSVSLMNTFFALVLPGLASGYSIFLLKGFFDSLPTELYEAGMLDGASEVRMFFSITMPLCKPVLAVIALSTFTHAYGAFMFAFLTCQDPKMWTLMVFLYQFQQQYSVPMVMASLVIASIPTLAMFILAQGVILRGIVIPTFK